jgi:hypothetical protein
LLSAAKTQTCEKHKMHAHAGEEEAKQPRQRSKWERTTDKPPRSPSRQKWRNGAAAAMVFPLPRVLSGPPATLTLTLGRKHARTQGHVRRVCGAEHVTYACVVLNPRRRIFNRYRMQRFCRAGDLNPLRNSAYSGRNVFVPMLCVKKVGSIARI